MDQIETIRRELHARRRKWRHISDATGVAPKTLRRLYADPELRPHQTTLTVLAEYFRQHPVERPEAAEVTS